MDINEEILWQSDIGITVIVDPSYGLIRKLGSESDESNHLAGFHGCVEILSLLGNEIASFSGSDEYSGHVELVWKITRKRHHRYPDDLGLSDIQLWTLYHSSLGKVKNNGS